MELLQLKYFQVVARNEHMTRSAEELYVSQPAVSSTVARLERELGVPLFDRLGRRMILNEYGRAFLRRVNNILLEEDNAKRELAALRGEHNWTVTISTTSPQLLHGIAIPFTDERPDIKLRIRIGSIEDCIKMLETGASDFSLTLPGFESCDIDSRVLLEDEYVLVVPSQHPFSKRKSISIHEVAGENIIALHKGFAFRAEMDELFGMFGIKPNITIECDHFLRREMLKENKGLTLSVRSAEIRKLYAANSRFLRIKETLPKQHITLSIRKNKYRSQASLQLEEYIVKFFKGVEQQLGAGNLRPNIAPPPRSRGKNASQGDA